MLRRERGSVLLLVPAGVLIVVVLGSLAVDFGIAFLGEREVASLATAAANDAVAAGLNEEVLRQTGEFELDPEIVHDVVLATIEGSSTDVDLELPPDIDILVLDGQPAVRVQLTGRVDYVFADALPGAPDGIEVSASATAVAREGAG